MVRQYWPAEAMAQKLAALRDIAELVGAESPKEAEDVLLWFTIDKLGAFLCKLSTGARFARQLEALRARLGAVGELRAVIERLRALRDGADTPEACSAQARSCLQPLECARACWETWQEMAILAERLGAAGAYNGSKGREGSGKNSVKRAAMAPPCGAGVATARRMVSLSVRAVGCGRPAAGRQAGAAAGRRGGSAAARPAGAAERAAVLPTAARRAAKAADARSAPRLAPGRGRHAGEPRCHAHQRHQGRADGNPGQGRGQAL